MNPFNNMSKDVMKEFITKVDDIFGVLNILKISSDVDKFKKWLRKEHQLKECDRIFRGYQFFLESVIRTLLQTLIYDSSLDIKEDFIFHRARFKEVELSKVPNTCEKTVLIRNINERLRAIKRAKNYKEIKEALKNFQDVIEAIDKIFADYVSVSPKLTITKEEALRYATMFYTFVFLNDTSHGYPHGYFVSVLESTVSSQQYEKSFEGYKYALQFVWFLLLGKDYYSTSLKDLHKAKGWRTENRFEKFVENLTKSEAPKDRVDLDSYFSKVKREVIAPIEKKFDLNLGFDKLLNLDKKVPKNIFEKLLTSSKEPELNEQETLDYLLLWYPVEFMDYTKSHIFNGVPAFVNLLTGSTELKRIYAKGEKAYVCKFTHPDITVNGNDYSYGILIEAMGSTGFSDYSGWMLFFDCCGDYSGFAGSSHAIAETFIETYQEQDSIELREMVIDKKAFKEYIADKISAEKRESIIEELDEISKERRKRDIVGEARGLVLELITYYTLSKKQYNLVDWNIKINEDQLDIILESDANFILIECKTQPKDLDDEITKIHQKLENYSTTKRKKCEFWYWHRPPQKVLNRLNEEEIEWEIVSEIVENDPAWRHKKLDKLKNIFNKEV